MQQIRQPRIRRRRLWNALDKVTARLGDNMARLMGRHNTRQGQRTPGRILLDSQVGEEEGQESAMGFGLMRFPRRLENCDTGSEHSPTFSPPAATMYGTYYRGGYPGKTKSHGISILRGRA